MVRHYKQKGGQMKWSDEDMAQAIDHARRYKNVKGAAKNTAFQQQHCENI